MEIDGTLPAALTTLMNLTTLISLMILTELIDFEGFEDLTILKVLIDLTVVIAGNIAIVFCVIRCALVDGYFFSFKFCTP